MKKNNNNEQSRNQKYQQSICEEGKEQQEQDDEDDSDHSSQEGKVTSSRNLDKMKNDKKKKCIKGMSIKGGEQSNKKRKKKKEKKKIMDAVSEESETSKIEGNIDSLLPKTPPIVLSCEENLKSTWKREGTIWGGERTKEELKMSRQWYMQECKKSGLKQWEVNQEEELIGLEQSFEEGIIEYQRRQTNKSFSSARRSSQNNSKHIQQRDSSSLLTDQSSSQQQQQQQQQQYQSVTFSKTDKQNNIFPEKIQFHKENKNDIQLKEYQTQAQTNTLKKLGTLFEAIDTLSGSQKQLTKRKPNSKRVHAILSPIKQLNSSPIGRIYTSSSCSALSPSSSSQMLGKIEGSKTGNKFYSQSRLSSSDLFSTQSDLSSKFLNLQTKQKLQIMRADLKKRMALESPSLCSSDILEGTKIIIPSELNEKCSSTQTQFNSQAKEQKQYDSLLQMLNDKYKAAINTFEKQYEDMHKRNERSPLSSTARSKNGQIERETARHGGFQYIQKLQSLRQECNSASPVSKERMDKAADKINHKSLQLQQSKEFSKTKTEFKRVFPKSLDKSSQIKNRKFNKTYHDSMSKSINKSKFQYDISQGGEDASIEMRDLNSSQQSLHQHSSLSQLQQIQQIQQKLNGLNRPNLSSQRKFISEETKKQWIFRPDQLSLRTTSQFISENRKLSAPNISQKVPKKNKQSRNLSNSINDLLLPKNDYGQSSSQLYLESSQDNLKSTSIMKSVTDNNHQRELYNSREGSTIINANDSAIFKSKNMMPTPHNLVSDSAILEGGYFSDRAHLNEREPGKKVYSTFSTHSSSQKMSKVPLTFINTFLARYSKKPYESANEVIKMSGQICKSIQKKLNQNE